MRRRSIALPHVAWLLPGVALGLLNCQSASEIGAGSDAASSSPLTSEAILEMAGVYDPDLEPLVRRSPVIGELLTGLVRTDGVSLLEVRDAADFARPWLAERAVVHVQGAAGRGPTIARTPPVVVVEESLLYSIESADCSRELVLEVDLDPEVAHLFKVNELLVTCTDPVGTRNVRSVLFKKNGLPGQVYASPGMRGLDGFPVGDDIPPASSNGSCGDAGQDGTDAYATPAELNHGGDGADGAEGYVGGHVAPTWFAVLGTLNETFVSFELQGGDGGDGQGGGSGGTGGMGQDGGDASSGMPACCTGTCDQTGCHLTETKAPGAGGMGGDGGMGGNGGLGGVGGVGGVGGTGGTLVALIEKASVPFFSSALVNGGVGGRGGAGGPGGGGGLGGRGGLGGYDGVNCKFEQGGKESDGTNGQGGVGGASGGSGFPGEQGLRGAYAVVPYSATLPVREAQP